MKNRKEIVKAHLAGDTATVQELLASVKPFSRHAILSAHRNGDTGQFHNLLDLAESGQLEADEKHEAQAPVMKTGSNPHLSQKDETPAKGSRAKKK